MSLSDHEIRSAIKRGDIEIDPYNTEQLGPNSYDLRLGKTLKLYEDDVLDPRTEPSTYTVELDESGYVLRPDELYLGMTLEWTRIHNLVPMLEGKSSLARLGVSVVSDGGFGDIGFQGHWTLELSVKRPVRVYPEMPICQMFFHYTGPCERPYLEKDISRYGERSEPAPYTPSDEHGDVERPETPRTAPLYVRVEKLDHAGGLRLPERETVGASGMDLRAALDEPITLKPGGEPELILTGLKVSIPEGFEGQIRARSGLASDGIIVPNGPGTIDSDYRGEVGVLLQNHGSTPHTVDRGDRIAQFVVSRIVPFDWEEGDLDDTERGSGGFGSTGA